MAYVKKKYKILSKKDLVLLQRFIIDNKKERKLKPRQRELYVRFKKAKPKILRYLRDFKSQVVKKHYAFNALKIYVSRESKDVKTFNIQVSLS